MFLQEAFNACPIYMLISAIDFKPRAGYSIPATRIIDTPQANSVSPIPSGAEEVAIRQWNLAPWARAPTPISYASHQDSAWNVR